jgi:hypothetical protein
MISFKSAHFPKDIILYAVFLVLSQILNELKSRLPYGQNYPVKAINCL